MGVDEIQWRKGHRCLTSIYPIDRQAKRLLWIGKERTTKTLPQFFRKLGKARSARLRFIGSDMGKPYLKVIAKKAGRADAHAGPVSHHVEDEQGRR